MAQICEICGKKSITGCRVSHAHNVSKRIFKPNLQSVRALKDGRKHKMMVCTDCIKAGRVIKVA